MGQIVKVVLRSCEAFWEERRPGLAFFNAGGRRRFRHGGRRLPPRSRCWPAGPEDLRPRRSCGCRTSSVSIERSRLLGSLFGMRIAKLRGLLAGWHAHDWSGDSFARGAYSYVGPGGAGAPRALARPIADTLCFAGEATEPDENGTVPGAIASGRRAARLILEGGGSRGAFRPPRGRTA